MQKEKVSRSEISLIGLAVRTNNKNEMNAETAKIGELVRYYHQEEIAAQIPNRTNFGVTLSVYTDYDSDEHGNYTYFIGEEVDSFEDVPENLHALIIPPSHYQKLTTPAGQMPTVVIQAWQQIWKMNDQELGGKRTYLADFEVYDHRAIDPQDTIVDIYIGIE